MSEVNNTKRCQCGAAVQDKFCDYCRADNRTGFQKGADAVVEGASKVTGQIATGAKDVATGVAKGVVTSIAIIWTIIGIIALVVIISVVVIVVVIVNNVTSQIGLLNIVANFFPWI